MADDLDDEWWKETSDAKTSESDESDSDEATEAKQGVKRPASTSSSDEEQVGNKSKSTPPSKKAKREKSGKGKKKKRKQSRRKITEEDEDSLHKGGTPADVLSLIQTRALNADSSDDDNDEGIPLDPDTDFFPTNRRFGACKYLSQVLPAWQKTMKKSQLAPGCPLLLVMTSSAIRAVQLKRDLKDFLGKDCKTAKLFAKHMKLEEQKKFLKKSKCHVGIGTPNRVQALLQAGSLKLDNMLALVLDWNWRDVKLKRMVDIPDVKRDLTQLLRDFVVENVKNSHCKIAIL
ncbi:hypothetical protein BaRGS_00005443 [Batillaria attramentaria]|uniref:Protein CMSS1 n=1 Tax=Batillaria attramentaria TaxID=370345 RepID=A0ABD0LVL3_9CAEN